MAAAEMLDSVVSRERVNGKAPRGALCVGDNFTLTDIALCPWFEQAGAFEQLSEFRLPFGCVISPNGAG